MLYVKRVEFTCSESAARILRDAILDTADFAEDSARGTNEQDRMGHVVHELRAIAYGIEKTLVAVATPCEYDQILGIVPKVGPDA